MSDPLEIPTVVANKARELGSEAWLDQLPALVADIEQRWRLQVGLPFTDATEALVLAATTEAGTEVVLKLVVPRNGTHQNASAEASVLRLVGGEGCVTLLDADESVGALLLERLGPSLHDLGLPIRARHEILCQTAQRFWRPLPSPATGLGLMDELGLATGPSLMTGAEKGRWLIEHITRLREELDRPCSERAVDHAVACAERRITAHDDERSVLVHGDVHEWNVLRTPGPELDYKLIDPDGLLAEPAYDLGIIMREDPLELMAGDPRSRAVNLGRRCGVDPDPIWEWGVVERVSTGLLCAAIDLQPVGRQMLEAADRIAER